MSEIKAEQDVQLRLLDVQAIDTALSQLDHRRKTLPEHAVIAKLRSDRAALSSDLVASDTAVSDLELEQARAEKDLEPVRERLVRNQQRIANGTVDSKSLGSMVDEVEHLKKRIGDLEDAELEIMEQLETEVAGRQILQGRLARLDEELATLSAKRDQQLVELDRDVAERRTTRGELTPQLPTPLLALYEKIGASHSGVGAAALRQRRCTGCQLEVNAADLRVFAAAPVDEVLRCEECGRILIRTDESGF
ncbi:MAG TPA: C4-type zinc ribbon domain-containing protein [Propionibacteriaceae bacterium]